MFCRKGCADTQRERPGYRTLEARFFNADRVIGGFNVHEYVVAIVVRRRHRFDLGGFIDKHHACSRNRSPGRIGERAVHFTGRGLGENRHGR